MRPVPPGLVATAPPPVRDGVRLMVARARRPLRHRRFTDLPSALEPGDLLVVNTSDTEPAALDGTHAGRPVVLHVSGPAAADTWVVELRTPDGHRIIDGRAGETVRLPCGVGATLISGGPRIWRVRIAVEGGLRRYLAAAGRPITYSYLHGRPSLAEYRTVFARPDGRFGSAEMPSAGRPFTPAVLDGLRTRGVGVAELVLHTGVSSLEAGETPLPERYRVPPATAEAVTATRAAGHRVVAVGTTVTRALETVAAPDGTVRAGEGTTELVLGPDRPARVVDGLVTGWHEPEASHLLLLRAVAGRRLVERAYAAALDEGYRWHEFGDSCLLLP
ncbi:S-adenosylmethionine:tRNA ribosyltransferase-isomerase [Pseudonocardia sp. RS11V-5]|uniref:S-adenosylmethionine:tRNA ribosyltransferase-isomerase n=1 Tax=Pseudonocardia terrae TaxID=2905831 RepID=UPI001E28A207|nr:S-adenosylmethionine:tRNA ribosyltransferase-isomerase [Pseudonocardia terrae]MCE3550604.1 S-adenosylmethionine:tRNA ribosyltransferase-isomerase [Pseudonocardia terrae]